ncbi:S-adenosylmethionine-dependent methyltransferase [Protomyces lactucae-debilis]|uniref:Protein kish n=1 Tax=Protomyces lactucae-debilis TaxID=2754530 RepID=A0A1Y2FI30_PROLT|nr:S-adenosylmethionine-dependent methyltransferase [Protomyces lactucae-debilis]ORY82465.1 S-adenosylmethionine-dependent methyltransferase [Protomyces lactucae-debilis]
MTALFNLQSLLTALLLLICTCTYVRSYSAKFMDSHKSGPLGTFWKLARVGERLSPYVSLSLIAIAASTQHFRIRLTGRCLY